MCNDLCWQLGDRLKAYLQPNVRVLEVGSRIVNGSLREKLEDAFPDWTGIDLMNGPGVDVLLDSTRISEHFPFASFDVVISTGMLEHCRDWRRAVLEMVRVLRPGGLLLLTTRSPGFELHEYPADYWRFTPRDMTEIFRPAASTLALEDDMTLDFPCGVGIIVRKHDRYDDRAFQKHLGTIQPACVENSCASDLDLGNAILFDQDSRLGICAEILGVLALPGDSVLDVGGGPQCQLGRYLTDLRVTYLDPLIADIPFPSVHQLAGRLDAAALEGKRFDHIVAIDVLEHIPAGEREDFVRKLVSLARKHVILLFPSMNEIQALKVDCEVNAVFKDVFGHSYQWLSEHFSSPLPDTAKVMEIFSELGWHSETHGHANATILAALLPLILVLWEIPQTRPYALRLSQDFENSLRELDKCPPFYRSCVVASSEGPAGIQKLFMSSCKTFEESWQAFCQRIDRVLQDIELPSPFPSIPDATDNVNGQNYQTITKVLAQQRFLLLRRERILKRALDQKDVSTTMIFGRRVDWVMGMKKKWDPHGKGYGVLWERVCFLAECAVKKFLPVWALQRLRGRQHFRGKKELIQSLKANDGRTIIVFPIIPWGFRWQRPQQLVSRIALRGYTAIYVSMDMLPRGRKYRGEDRVLDDVIFKNLQKNVFEIFLQSENKCCIYKRCLENGDLHNVLSGISAVIEGLPIKKSIFIVQFPSWYTLVNPLISRFNGALVFDCMDDNSGFENTEDEALRVEEDVLHEADLVLTSSSLLYERARTHNDNVLLVNNGTEFEHFHAATPNGKLDHLQDAPIIGYYGAIAEWFDVDLLASCAAARPHWHFVLIGSTTGCDTSAFQKLPNVHLLGEKPYADLPGYLAYFSVCTIPFKLIPLIMATNPVKFYEYMSSAKPIVSVDLPELKPFADLCYLARDQKEFLDKLDAAVSEQTDPTLLARRMAVARSNTWDARVDAILDTSVFRWK